MDFLQVRCLHGRVQIMIRRSEYPKHGTKFVTIHGEDLERSSQGPISVIREGKCRLIDRGDFPCEDALTAIGIRHLTNTACAREPRET
jgi:hypothetical protein